VQASLREISDDWDDVDTRRYRPAGASPVEESLEEITEGWDDLEPPSAAPAPRPSDVPSSPTQVYRDGSIYAYGYRDQAGTGQTDRIYAPPDDAYGGDYGDKDYGETGASAADLEDEGVVDADFRVIIPPAPSDPT
jgi:hypothetical protein